jgi:hypothetical protein
MGEKYEDRQLDNGGYERVHLGSDGRPNGRREFWNPKNQKTKAEMDAFYDRVHGDDWNNCTCGGRYEPYERVTRESNNFFGIGRKGIATGRKCSDCGRKEV